MAPISCMRKYDYGDLSPVRNRNAILNRIPANASSPNCDRPTSETTCDHTDSLVDNSVRNESNLITWSVRFHTVQAKLRMNSSSWPVSGRFLTACITLVEMLYPYSKSDGKLKRGPSFIQPCTYGTHHPLRERASRTDQIETFFMFQLCCTLFNCKLAISKSTSSAQVTSCFFRNSVWKWSGCKCRIYS